MGSKENINVDLAMVFNSIEDAMFVADTNNVITNANSSFAKLLNMKAEDIIGKRCYELMHRSSSPWFSCPFEKSKKDKKIHVEEVHDTSTGLDILVTTSPVFNRSGEMMGVVHISKDITDIKRAEEVLRKKSEELDVIMDSIPAFIFYKDKENRFIRVNKAFAKTMSLSKEKIEGRSCFDLYSRYDAEKYWEDDKHVIFTRKSRLGIVETMETPDGTAWVKTDKIPYRDDHGNIIGVIGFSIDITESKKAQMALEESEKKYESLYNLSADAIMILDPLRGFTGGNKAALRLFGCKSEDEFSSLSPVDLSPDYQPDGSSSSQKAQEVIALALKNGSHYFEWMHKRMNGEEFFASVLLSRIILKGVTVLQATVRDISIQKKMEEDLKYKIEELERFQKITIGRELKMKELKARIAELEAKTGEAE